MSSHGTFCTVFDCMDGRTKELIAAWCRQELHVDYPDTITIAGCDGVLTRDTKELARAMGMARISADKHHSKQAVVVGHSECAGHRVSNEQHRKDIEKAAKLVAGSDIFKNVIGLFLDVRTDEIMEVCRL